MVLRVALIAMLGLGLAAIGGLGWMLFPAPRAAPPAPPARIAVLAASQALRAGALIRPQDLQAAALSLADAPPGASRDTPSARAALTGAMVRRSLSPDQPILPDDIVRPGDHGFLAAVLKPGMRAVTVAVDAVSGTAGLIWPGDRVDVVMTQTVDDDAAGPGHHIAARTVLSDTRVIAVDQQLGQGQMPGPSADGAPPPANRTATLEVTPAQVERVLVAVKLGHLSLSVLSADRPAEAAAAPAEGSVTWESDVSPMLGRAAPAAPPVMVHVFQGDADGKEFHF